MKQNYKIFIYKSQRGVHRMQMEPLSLSHKSLLQPKLRALGLMLSEYSFASRFLFRREHEMQLLKSDETLWLIGQTSDHIKYVMPTEDPRTISFEKLTQAMQWADCLYPIPEIWLPFFQEKNFKIDSKRDDSDYLFNREKIAKYPGRHLSAKRNLVKQFTEHYASELVPFNQARAKDALSILAEWKNSLKENDSDVLACQDGIELADELGLIGYILYINQKPCAFILGEILAPHLFDIHFAKASLEYKGIYQYLFKEVAACLSLKDIRCLNWEQDLGKQGLRQAKLSYQPDKIVSKYRIFYANI